LAAVPAIALIIFGVGARASAFQLPEKLDPARSALLFSFPPSVFGDHGKGNGHGDGDGDDDDNGHKPGVVVPPPPCHPNATAAQDIETVAHRGDVVHLPDPLRDRLIELAGRPHSVLPVQARAEADKPSQLFQYYLLDTHGFEPNVFTALFPGINDLAQLTATGPACGLPTIGAVRLVVEPKPGLPTEPTDPRAFIDIFTDIEGLFVINNESGWYEGWMIHHLTVPDFAPPRSEDPMHAQFGKLLKADADQLVLMGGGHNKKGQIFTTDGNDVRLPSESDHFPDVQTNVIPSSSAWARTIPCSRATRTRIGSSTTPPTGSTRSTSCRSRVAFPPRSRTATSAPCRRSCPAQARRGRRTTR
jgi:hypothetical protein